MKGTLPRIGILVGPGGRFLDVLFQIKKRKLRKTKVSVNSIIVLPHFIHFGDNKYWSVHRSSRAGSVGSIDSSGLLGQIIRSKAPKQLIMIRYN